MKNVSDIYPLSQMQELMLVHSLARRENDLLFNQVVYRVEGEFDAVVYEQCWNELLKRHPILRTMFLWEGLKEPMQVVRESVTLDWQHLDWRTLSTEEQEARLDQVLQEDRHRGFELNRAPLMRFCLCRRADSCYTLIWSSHHLVLDRWCIGLLMTEIATLYDAQKAGRPARLEARRPFRDYIRWLAQQDAAAAERFWRAELQGITHTTRLDSASRTVKTDSLGEKSYRLDANFSARLRQYAAEHRLTLSTVVMGAWALLHGLVTGTEDLLLGITVSGRPPTLTGVEGIIGPFINNLPLRVSFSAEHSLTTWLQTLQERQQAIQSYGHMSPQQLQEWSELPASDTWSETLFLYQAPVNQPASTFQLRLERASLQTNFPLTLTAADDPDGLLILLTYQEQRYSVAAVTQFQLALVRILEGLTDAPGSTPIQYLEHLQAGGFVFASKAEAQTVELAADSRRVAPRNGLEARLFNLWAAVLGHESFSIHDNLFELGASSFQAVQLVSRIRQAFNRELPVATLFTAPTIEQLANLLADGSPLPPWSSLIPIKASGSKAPLYLVHHGGGGLFGYSDVARYLDSDRPLYGLQEPGIEDGQQLPVSVEEIASLYVREIQSVQPHGPYHLGGFCFGGVVAFEMAQQFRKIGEMVETLILLDAVLPGYAPQPTTQQRFARHQAQLAQASFSDKVKYLVGRVKRRAKWEVERRYIDGSRIVERMAFDVLEKSRRSVPARLRQRRLLQLNGQLNDAYTPHPYSGHVVLIRGTYPELHYSLDFGWNAVVQTGIVVIQMETQDHLQMLVEPNIHLLIQHLQGALEPG